MHTILKKLDKKRGSSTVGYGLLIGLIAVASLVAISQIGEALLDNFDFVGDRMQSGLNQPPKVVDSSPIGVGQGPKNDYDITGAILLRVSDPEGDVPYTFLGAGNADGVCVTEVKLSEQTVLIDTINPLASCMGSLSVTMSDSEGKVSKPLQFDILVDEDTCPNAGDICDKDGTIFAGITPDGGLKMFVMPTDQGADEWSTSNCCEQRSTIPPDSFITGANFTESLAAGDDGIFPDSKWTGATGIFEEPKQTWDAATVCANMNSGGYNRLVAKVRLF